VNDPSQYSFQQQQQQQQLNSV